MKPELNVIGISGKARNGKDSIADYLRDEYGYTVIHFADPLYQECHDLPLWAAPLPDKNKVVIFKIAKGDPLYRSSEQKFVTIDRPSFVTDELLKNGMKEKDPLLLQWWGTEVRRVNFGDTYWVDRAAGAITKIDGPVVMPDTRFKNEAYLVKDFGGLVVRVNRYRDGEPVVDPNRDPNHPSETDLNDFPFDWVFTNDGTLQDLYAQVQKFMEEHGVVHGEWEGA